MSPLARLACRAPQSMLCLLGAVALCLCAIQAASFDMARFCTYHSHDPDGMDSDLWSFLRVPRRAPELSLFYGLSQELTGAFMRIAQGEPAGRLKGLAAVLSRNDVQSIFWPALANEGDRAKKVAHCIPLLNLIATDEERSYVHFASVQDFFSLLESVDESTGITRLTLPLLPNMVEGIVSFRQALIEMVASKRCSPFSPEMFKAFTPEMLAACSGECMRALLANARGGGLEVGEVAVRYLPAEAFALLPPASLTDSLFARASPSQLCAHLSVARPSPSQLRAVHPKVLIDAFTRLLSRAGPRGRAGGVEDDLEPAFVSTIPPYAMVAFGCDFWRRARHDVPWLLTTRQLAHLPSDAFAAVDGRILFRMVISRVDDSDDDDDDDSTSIDSRLSDGRTSRAVDEDFAIGRLIGRLGTLYPADGPWHSCRRPSGLFSELGAPCLAHLTAGCLAHFDAEAIADSLATAAHLNALSPLAVEAMTSDQVAGLEVLTDWNDAVAFMKNLTRSTVRHFSRRTAGEQAISGLSMQAIRQFKRRTIWGMLVPECLSLLPYNFFQAFDEATFAMINAEYFARLTSFDRVSLNVDAIFRLSTEAQMEVLGRDTPQYAKNMPNRNHPCFSATIEGATWKSLGGVRANVAKVIPCNCFGLLSHGGYMDMPQGLIAKFSDDIFREAHLHAALGFIPSAAFEGCRAVQLQRIPSHQLKFVTLHHLKALNVKGQLAMLGGEFWGNINVANLVECLKAKIDLPLDALVAVRTDQEVEIEIVGELIKASGKGKKLSPDHWNGLGRTLRDLRRHPCAHVRMADINVHGVNKASVAPFWLGMNGACFSSLPLFSQLRPVGHHHHPAGGGGGRSGGRRGEGAIGGSDGVKLASLAAALALVPDDAFTLLTARERKLVQQWMTHGECGLAEAGNTVRTADLDGRRVDRAFNCQLYDSEAIAGMGWNSLKYMSACCFDQMTTEQVLLFEPHQIALLSPQALLAISPEKAAALSPPVFGAITREQWQGLRGHRQLLSICRAITAAQAAALDVAILPRICRIQMGEAARGALRGITAAADAHENANDGAASDEQLLLGSLESGEMMTTLEASRASRIPSVAFHERFHRLERARERPLPSEEQDGGSAAGSKDGPFRDAFGGASRAPFGDGSASDPGDVPTDNVGFVNSPMIPCIVIILVIFAIAFFV